MPPEKPDHIPAEVIFAVRRATAMGVLDCREVLRRASPLFYARFVEAVMTQGKGAEGLSFGRLHDPIEDWAEFADALEKAGQMADDELKTVPALVAGLGGMCHAFWSAKQRILREEFGIEWFSPAQMNPGTYFH